MHDVLVSIFCDDCDERIIKTVPEESAPNFYADCHPEESQHNRINHGEVI